MSMAQPEKSGVDVEIGNKRTKPAKKTKAQANLRKNHASFIRRCLFDGREISDFRLGFFCIACTTCFRLKFPLTPSRLSFFLFLLAKSNCDSYCILYMYIIDIIMSVKMDFSF